MEEKLLYKTGRDLLLISSEPKAHVSFSDQTFSSSVVVVVVIVVVNYEHFYLLFQKHMPNYKQRTTCDIMAFWPQN